MLFCLCLPRYADTHRTVAACGNYVIDAGEQCDDGNPFNGDGCSSSCQLEDQNTWLCKNATLNTGPTYCCRALVNPETSERVCTCSGYQTNSTIYTISLGCNKLNVDECAASVDDCHQNAICSDLNGAASAATKGYECICPPGLLGDGVSECQMYAYLTRFELALADTPLASFNELAFKQQLISSGIVPLNISLARISLDARSFTPAGTGRRSLLPSSKSRKLLQVTEGTAVVVTISSVSVGEQNVMTAGINTTLISSQVRTVCSLAS